VRWQIHLRLDRLLRRPACPPPVEPKTHQSNADMDIISSIFTETEGFGTVVPLLLIVYSLQATRSPDLNSWLARGGLATPFGAGTIAMARALDEIVRLDRHRFWAHPRRQHRCRWPDPCGLDLCECDRSARLVIAIRRLWRDCVVYQPVIFQGTLPAHEGSAAVLFALAATCPEPVPVFAQKDVLRVRRGLRQQTQSRAASAVVAWNCARGRSGRWRHMPEAAALRPPGRAPV
jgi:hypothetical protein